MAALVPGGRFTKNDPPKFWELLNFRILLKSLGALCLDRFTKNAQSPPKSGGNSLYLGGLSRFLAGKANSLLSNIWLKLA